MESFGLGSRTFNLETIFKSSSLTPEIQTHISNVYLGLTATVACGALGAYASARGVLKGGGDMLFVPAVALFGILMWLGSTRGVVTKARIAGLCGFGFLKGLTLGPLLAMAVGIDPSIVMTAFLGTAAVFVCFSLAALVAKRREYMYMGAFLSSAVMTLLVLSIANLFFRSAALFTFELYVGLLVFTGYVLVDTQVMVESAIAGNRDWVWHALELFIDFAAVFVRILIILLNNKKQENKRKQEQQRRRG